MIESDKQNFRELMIGVGELYNKEITIPLLRIYFNTLKVLSIEDVEIGISKHTANTTSGSFMPKPADIIRQIELCKPSTDDLAEMAWLQIINKIKTKGAYGKLDLDDKQAMAAAKNLGTWQSLCHTDSDKIQWKKKEFIEIYKTFDKTPTEMLPNNLAGIIELKNNRKQTTMKSLKEMDLGLIIKK